MLTVKYRCATERTATELASQVTGPNSQEPRIPSRGAMLGAMMRIRIAAPSDGALVTGAAPPCALSRPLPIFPPAHPAWRSHMAQHRTWHIAYDMTLAPTCRGVSGEGPPLIWGLFPSACNSWQVGMLSYQSELRERAKGPVSPLTERVRLRPPSAHRKRLPLPPASSRIACSWSLTFAPAPMSRCRLSAL